MKFCVVEPTGEEKVIYFKTPELKTLGELFKGHLDDIKAVRVNDEFLDDWPSYKFTNQDKITLYLKVEVGILVSILISVALSALASLLTPKPKKPSSAKSQPSVGVAGIQNTIAPGTPKFLTYGIRKVLGHLIGSQVDLIDPLNQPRRRRRRTPAGSTGKRMEFRALYFMGVGPICCLSDVKINNTHLADIYGPPIALTRLGTQDQTVLPGWGFCHQTYSLNQEMEVPLREVNKPARPPDPGIPATYTTKASNVNKTTFFFNFPQGLWAIGVTSGTFYPNFIGLKVLRKRNSEPEGAWVNLGIFRSVSTARQSGFFWKLEIENPDADQWDYQLNVEKQAGAGSWKSAPTMILYNVMETAYIETAYPGNALLEVHGVGSTMITGFDNMETSALVNGRLVDVPNNGIYTKQCSRNRVWIVRDLLLNRDVGLGNRVDPSLWDNASSQAAADYYEEDVTGFDAVTEQRDLCDVIVNDPKPGWDWIKTLLFEGRAALLPSQGKFKYFLDVDKTPSLLYSSPGNIITGTLQYQTGSTEKPINTIKGEFPDAANDYKVIPTKLVSLTIGDDPERPEQVSYVSLTRKSQVSREMNFLLKKRLLIDKRWNWKSPRTAIVSEPFDVDLLAYNVSKNLHGYTGFIDGGATTSRVPVGKEIYLAAGNTYSVHIRHENTVEESGLSNALGNTYSVLQLSTPLTFTPSVGDIWAVGNITTHKVKIQTEETEFDGENFLLKVHKHDPAVYDDSLLFDITALTGTTTASNFPQPLIRAQAINTSVNGITVGLFQVAPGFNQLAQGYGAIGTNTIVFDPSIEPNIDDFFTGASITADDDGPFEILDYLGSSRTAVVEDPGFTFATAGGSYNIIWEGYTPYYGFSVEGAATTGSIFSSAGISPSQVEGDTEFSTVLALPGSYNFYRFTPFDRTLSPNLTGRWVVPLNTRDITPPLPPVYVDCGSADKVATADVRLAAPVERDLKEATVTFVRGSPTSGSTLSPSVTFDLSAERDETSTFVAGSEILDLDDEAYGTTIFAKVVTTDYFGNSSLGAISVIGTTLSSSINTDYTSNDIEDERRQIILGGSNTTVYSGTVPGGIIAHPSDAVRLDSLMTTSGSVSMTFFYAYGGTTVSTLAVTASGSQPVWATLVVEPFGDIQKTKAFTYREGSFQQFISTSAIDATIDQPILITAQVSGGTVTVEDSILRAITYNNGLPIDASDVIFAPGITANWPGTPPDTVDEALDDLAARIVGLTVVNTIGLLGGTTLVSGNVKFNAGSGITITQSGQNFTFAASASAGISSSLIYVVAGSLIGKPDAGQTVIVHPFTDNVSIPVNGGQSHGAVLTAPAVTASFLLRKVNNSGTTQFGTMQFSPGVTMATFIIAATTSFLQASNDIITVIAPATQDATLADLGFGIRGNRD